MSVHWKKTRDRQDHEHITIAPLQTVNNCSYGAIHFQVNP